MHSMPAMPVPLTGNVSAFLRAKNLAQHFAGLVHDGEILRIEMAERRRASARRTRCGTGLGPGPRRMRSAGMKCEPGGSEISGALPCVGRCCSGVEINFSFGLVRENCKTVRTVLTLKITMGARQASIWIRKAPFGWATAVARLQTGMPGILPRSDCGLSLGIEHLPGQHSALLPSLCLPPRRGEFHRAYFARRPDACARPFLEERGRARQRRYRDSPSRMDLPGGFPPKQRQGRNLSESRAAHRAGGGDPAVRLDGLEVLALIARRSSSTSSRLVRADRASKQRLRPAPLLSANARMPQQAQTPPDAAKAGSSA